MTAKVYILIDKANNVINSMMWDGDPENWQAPKGITAIQYDGAWQDGWMWDGSKAYNPNPEPEPIQPPKVNLTKQANGMVIL